MVSSYSITHLVLIFSVISSLHSATIPSLDDPHSLEDVSTLVDKPTTQEEVELIIPVSADLYPGYHQVPDSSSRTSSTGGRTKRATLNSRYRQKSRRQPNLSGDVVFSARRAFRLFFDFDYSSLSRTEILSAHVVLYQTRPRHTKRNRKYRSVDDDETPEVGVAHRDRRDLGGDDLEKVKDKSARVIMHQTIDFGEAEGSTQTMDIKMVDSRTRGWVAFDITPAVKDWISESTTNQGLELWVVSSRPGKRAARSALRMKFVKPNSHRAAFRPELVVKLKPASKNATNNLTTA